MDDDTFWQIVDDARTRAGRGADDRGAEDDPLPDALTAVLVLAGRDVFSRTVADPDPLVEHPVVAAMAGDGGWFGYESLDAVVGDAWTRVTGCDDEDYYEARETAAPPAAEPDIDSGETPVGASTNPTGESWDFDDEDENRRRLPRLAALFS